MVKVVFKLLLCSVIFTVGIMLAYLALPFSHSLTEERSSEGLMTFLLTIVKNGWVCFVIYFIIKHTKLTGIKLFVNLFLAMFFVLFFIPQAELLIFIDAFPALAKWDAFLFMLCGLFPMLATIPIMMKFFQGKQPGPEGPLCSGQQGIMPFAGPKNILVKFGVIGLVYCFLYYFFGMLVSWLFEEVITFYSGSGSISTHKYSIQLFYIQIIRGILFAISIIPIKIMLNKNKKVFILGICFVYLSMGFMLLSPNALFPDMVRYAHLMEMSACMLIFGIIVGNILWEEKR